MKDYRGLVNQRIRDYWKKFKRRLTLSRLRKEKVPSFNRINASKIHRVGEKWRYPTGRGAKRVLKPSVGYKRPKSERFRRGCDGLLFRLISSQKELSGDLKEKEIYMIKARTGARVRQKILLRAKELGLPLYIR